MNVLFSYQHKKALILYGIFIVFIALTSCTKSGFLEASPNEKLIIPNTLSDFRLLVDNSVIMNGFGVGLCPGLGEVGSDNYHINETLFNVSYGIKPVYKEMYTWGDYIFSDPNKKPEDWGFPYRCIAYANVILEGLEKINSNNAQQNEFNDIKGAAFFFRAHMYYQLMQIFAPVYDRETAKNQYGVPIRLNPDIGTPSQRATVEDVYTQIIADSKNAASLLQDKQSLNTRPSKSAAFGLLARVFLSMQDYNNALENANKCLLINDELLDYNSLSASNFFPIQRSNKEIIFYSLMNIYTMELLNYYYSRIDNNLYDSYKADDLRKKIFFLDAASNLGIPDDPGYFFRGNYDGSEQRFAGIATDEIYLIRAECNARTGNVSAAMDDLNTLMQKRWDNKVAFPTFTATSKEDALEQILTERRKELIFRGLRWTDLRRLNKEGANITITRTYEGQTYTLEPNSLRYTFLIPDEVINLNPGMPQNAR